MKNNQDKIIKQVQDPRKRLKKRMLIIIASLLAFMLLYIFVLQNIDVDSFFAKEKQGKYNPTNPTLIFSPIDYDEDIFLDSAYMDKDRNIYFNNGSKEISLNENGKSDYSGYGEAVELLANMVDFIIGGNNENYNECFSSVYYSNKDNKPKDEFTKQKLYNITITKYSEEDVSVNGIDYTEYIYILEYMIFKNNGTFRNDIGSDAIRTQYIKMTDRTGEVLIDTVSNITNK